MSTPVFICANAFGPLFIKQHSHATAIRLAARSGASGLEVREELLTSQDYPLPQLKALLDHHQLACTFSASTPLWHYDHCNLAPLCDAVEKAATLGASRCKVGIGTLPQDPTVSHQALQTLAEQLQHHQIRLLIENDQTPEGGSIQVMTQALALLSSAGIEAALTFDTGNWYWVGENPVDAARQLGAQVDYVHCKSIDIIDDHPRVCPARAPHLADWSTLWTAFQPHTLRAIEFPLLANDSPQQSHDALVASAHEFVTRLSRY